MNKKKRNKKGILQEMHVDGTNLKKKTCIHDDKLKSSMSKDTAYNVYEYLFLLLLWKCNS